MTFDDKDTSPHHDPLADAPLGPEQRRVWEATRAEVKLLRAQIQQMERTQTEEGASHAVLNRPEFNREVARMLAFDERYGGASSVVYFDFENWDKINTALGRAVANAAVRHICDTLVRYTRSCDIVGRLGTNEFGVLLARCDNAAAWKKGAALATALHQALAEIHGHPLQPSLTYGAYTFRAKEDVATGLKQAAAMVTRGEGSL